MDIFWGSFTFFENYLVIKPHKKLAIISYARSCNIQNSNSKIQWSNDRFLCVECGAMTSNCHFNSWIWSDLFSKSWPKLLCIMDFSLRNSKKSLDDKNNIVHWYDDHTTWGDALKKIETNWNKGIMFGNYLIWDANFHAKLWLKINILR